MVCIESLEFALSTLSLWTTRVKLFIFSKSTTFSLGLFYVLNGKKGASLRIWMSEMLKRGCIYE